MGSDQAPEAVAPSGLEVHSPPSDDVYPGRYSPYGQQPQQDTYAYHYGSVAGHGALQHEVASGSKRNRERRLMGMRPSTLWLVILLVVVIIAAAVGGGVGGSLAVANAKNQAAASAVTTNEATTSSTPPPGAPSGTSSSSASSTTGQTTPSTNTASVFTVPTNVVLPLDCPAINSQPQTVTYKSDGSTATFAIQCNMNAPMNDLALFLSYSLGDCLTACAVYNYYLSAENPSGRVCKGVVFDPDIQRTRLAQHGNCWLKSAVDSGVSVQGPAIGRLSGL